MKTGFLNVTASVKMSGELKYGWRADLKAPVDRKNAPI
jgi:hypothetical protein